MEDPKMDPKAAIDKTNKAAVDAVSGLFQGLPGTPVPADKYDLFASAANAALDRLSGSTAPPEFRLPPAAGDFTGFTPSSAAGLAAIKVALDKVPEGEPYRFEVSDLEDAAGFMEVADRLQRASSDEPLARKLTSPPGPAAAPPPKKEAKGVMDPVAFTSDATNDNRKTKPFTSDATNDNRKTKA